MNRRGIAVALVALSATAVGAWAWVRDDDAKRVRPERRDVVITVPLEGELEAASTERLGPPRIRGVWNFKISFMAPEGSEVEAGDPVLRFDGSDLEQQLFRQTGERDRAAKEVEKRRLELEKERRGKQLTHAEAGARLRRADLELAVPPEIEAPAVVRQAEIDRRLAELELASIDSGLAYLDQRAHAEIDTLVRRRDRAAARVTELSAQIESLTVRAPRAGTVIYVAESRTNQKKKIGDSVWVMAKVIELPDLGSLRAKGHVAEADAGKIRLGQAVRLRFDAFPDRIVHGRVDSVRRTVQTKPGSANQAKIVRLEVVLDNADPRRMRPGMRFRGAIETERLDQALVVPKEAVFFGSEGAELRVAGLSSSRVIRPTFGIADDDGMAVLSGLDEDTWLEVRPSGAAP